MFEVITPLGSGGMGEVYLARDLRLGRRVAIKTLPDEMARDPVVRSRFEREAKALAALAHPNIVAIYEFDDVDGVAFSVMEMLEGATLASRIAREPMQWTEAVNVALGVASGVAAAHEKGIIHRDLKPANVFLTADGQVKVLDFGIARADLPQTAHDATTASLHTMPGAIVGTIGYVAPEVLRGHHADARSDIFSLGCVLYESLTGQRAFLRETPVATLAAILTDPPTPSPRIAEQVPVALQKVIDRCLAKDPKDRYASVRDLIAALNEIGSAIGHQHVRSRVSKFHARWLMAVLLVIAVVAAIVFAVPRLSHPAIHSIAVLPFENGSSDPELDYLSEGMTEGLINSLSRVASLRVVARTTVFRYRGTKLAPQKIAQQLDADAIVAGRLLVRNNVITVQSDLIDARDGRQLWGERTTTPMSDVMNLQQELAQRITKQLHVQLGGPQPATSDDAAYRLYLKGRFFWNKRNEDGYQKAIAYYNEAIKRDPQFALAYSGLADCYVLSYTLPEAETMRRAKAAAQKAIAIDDSLAEPHTSLGHVLHYFDWDWPGSEREFRRALELNPNYVLAHHWYGRHLVQTGHQTEGIAEIKRALDLDPLSLIVNTDLGYAYYLAGRNDQAIAQLKRALDLDPSFLPAHIYLAWTYIVTRDGNAALAEAKRAVDFSGGAADTLALLGAAEWVHGDRAAAEQMLHDLTERAKKSYVAPLFMIQFALVRGDVPDAVKWLQKAVDDQERSSTLDISCEPLLEPYRNDPRIARYLPPR